MAQENLEQNVVCGDEDLNALVESLSKLSIEALRQVMNSLSEEQQRRIFVILYGEKSTADLVCNDDAHEKE